MEVIWKFTTKIRSTKGSLTTFCLWKMFAKSKYHMKDSELNTIKNAIWGSRSCSLDVPKILYFIFVSLTLAKIKHGRRSEIISGAIQRAEDLCRLRQFHIYFVALCVYQIDSFYLDSRLFSDICFYFLVCDSLS